MNTYKCDIWLEFGDDRYAEFLVGQLFSVDSVDDLQGAADDWYKKHAGAIKVFISSYQLI